MFVRFFELKGYLTLKDFIQQEDNHLRPGTQLWNVKFGSEVQ